MLRILLFLGTNVAILLIMSVTMRILGIDTALQTAGGGMNLTGLLIMSGIMGMSGSLISLAMSKWMAKKSMGVKIIETPENKTESWLLSTVEMQAQEAGIGMPEVGIFDSASPNAFATGMNKNNALVAVSTGLMQHMNQDEVEAVLAHEVSHVANGDMVTLSLIQGVVNTFVIFFSRIIGMLIDKVVFKVERGHGPGFWIGTIVAQVVLSILASVIVMWFSRWREFRADEGGAKLAGKQKMISALRKLQQQSNPQPLPDEMAAFGINSGLASGIKKLFMTHPPLDERIEALEKNLEF